MRCKQANWNFDLTAGLDRISAGTTEINGKTSKGTYWVAGKILTVSTGMGGTTPAEDLAKQLFQELAKEGKA